MIVIKLTAYLITKNSGNPFKMPQTYFTVRELVDDITERVYYLGKNG